MTLNQTLIVALLLGLTVTSGAATSLCVSDMTRCVCNVMAILNPPSLECFFASELELRDGKLGVGLSEMHIFDIDPTSIQFFHMDKLIFYNVTISSSFISEVIPLLSQLNLNKMNIISSTLEVAQPLEYPELKEASTIKSLLLEDVTVDPSLLQPSFQALHRWLFGSLESLVLVRSGPVQIDCNWAGRVENLTRLDLSENLISFTSLQNILHCSSLSFKYLKSLRLRLSNLTSLQSLCTLLSLTPALTELDVSRNNFSTIHYPHCFQVTPLRMLNLSHSGITEINSLLNTSLEELDLSFNSLEVFNDPPQTLKKLNLSNNRLIRLSSLNNLFQLQELKVDSNQLTVLINETAGVSLSTLEKLVFLHAGRNPYQCHSALNETIVFLDNAGSVFVEDYPEEFLCASPVDLQGTQIMNLSPETSVKPTSGTQCGGSPLCLTLFMSLLLCLIYFC
ncbi:toll-like receptor 2 [Cottoperca gobio]|uniref:Monocyte differentiation antigen CD14 n=1 Tax=Cottoperca gobio TaxID=56716 RepID=A0A6J2QIC4_COTGO|nr:toll-like receptor 2 [Cottoperca gobio]